MDASTNKLSGLLSAEEATATLLALARPPQQSKRIRTENALGRVLAQPAISTINVPSFDNSAMDGYAVRTQDVQSNTTLPISQRIPAGTHPAPLQPGTAARIFTGAPIPAGADAVVMQEHCELIKDSILVQRITQPGDHIRRQGDDIRNGAQALGHGLRLTPQALGMAASVGLAELEVFPRLRVALFTTGDELVAPGTPLQPGQIYNSNRATLYGLLQQLGCEIIDLGQVEDTLSATQNALREASACADVILTSGGVSVGEEDHVKEAVQSLGQLDLWRIAIKPGKPLAFGRVANADFIGLPGNPVSAFVTFLLFARPFLLKRMGVEKTSLFPTPLKVQAGFAHSKSGTRREYFRVRIEQDHGELRATPYNSQSSGVLSSCVWAEGLAVVPEGITFEKGKLLDYLPFSELMA
jgi:molybdopterin molybdotransferase